MQSSINRRRAARAAALFTSATVALIGLGALPASAAPGDVSIDVYTINDFHGHLEQNLSSGEAGAASIATAVASFRAANPNATLVSAGDNISGSPFISQALNDEPTIDVLNQIGVSVTSLGNHEFDHGRSDVDGRISDRSNFPYISANLFDTATGEHAYAPYNVQTFDGVKVGFIGAVTEDLPTLVNPDGINTLKVAGIVESVNAAAAELKDGIDDGENGEADVLVLLMHEGAASATANLTDPNTVFGEIVTGTAPSVDAIASAHTHNLYAQNVTVGSKTLPVLQTASYGTNLGHFNFQVNPTSKAISSSTAETIPLVVKGVAAYAQDPTVAAIVADAKQRSSVIGLQPVGSISADFKRAVQTDGKENRGGESTLGNIVADGQLWATRDLGTQLAFMNPGGLRADIAVAPDGVVTYEESATVQPFANSLFTQTLTGAQVKTVLEQQWQPGQSRPFLKLGINKALSYTYDPSAATGSHVTEIRYNGAVVSDTDSFQVVTNSFLAGGGDNFKELALGAAKTDTGRVDLDAFKQYIGANSPLTPDYGSRSIGVTLTSPATTPGTPIDLGTVAPETTFSFALSSLVLSGAPVQDSTVSVQFDGVEIATAPINPAIVDTFDEQGTATVEVTVPKLTRNGDHVVSFVLPTTGKSVSLPVTTTGEIPFVAPDAPAAPTLAADGFSAVTASWAPPAVDGGTPVTGYEVTLYADGTKADSASVDAATTSVGFAGLKTDTDYTATVKAINAVGSSAESQASNVITTPLPKPTTEPALPSAESLPATETDAFSLSTGSATNGQAVTVSGLTPGDWYYVSIFSDPVRLGWFQADESGSFSVTISNVPTGTHRLVIQDRDGTVIGYRTIVVAADGTVSVVDPAGSAGASPTGLAATGMDATLPLLGAGLLLAAGALLTLRRRRAARSTS